MYDGSGYIQSVQSLSHVWFFADPMDCIMPGFPVLHHLWSLLKLMSVEWVMLIQPSHPLWFPSPPAFNPSQLAGSFPMSQFLTSGGQSIGVSTSPSLLPINIQDWFPLGLTDLIFLQSKGLSRVFSSTTIQKYQFFSAQPSLWSNSHIPTWLPQKPQLWLYGPLSAKSDSAF